MPGGILPGRRSRLTMSTARDDPPPGPPAPATEAVVDDTQTELQRFRLMADSVPVLIAYYSAPDLVCRYANRAYAATFGHDAPSLVGRSLGQIVGDETLHQIQPHIDRMLAEGVGVSYTRAMAPAGGNGPRWLDVSLVPELPVLAPNPPPAPPTAEAAAAAALPGAIPVAIPGAFVLITDITRFRQAELALHDSQARLRKFMDASVEGIAFHRDGVITDVNAPIAALLGLARNDMLGRHVLEFVAPEHRPRAEQGRAQPSELPYESALLDHRGQPLAVEIFARELQRDGEPLRMVVVRDIRDRQAARARMQHLAEHDALTGLHNRGAFMAKLTLALAAQRPDEAPTLALLFVDLDHFKQVNDAHGHPAGDALLRGVAERLRAQLPDGGVAGRFGGDEFVILLPAAGRAEAQAAALRLQAAMAEPVHWLGQLIGVTPTIGVALFPEHGHQADTLLRHADAAMYAGKAAGRAVVTLFAPAMTAAIESDQRLDTRIADGLARGEFHLMLQPRLAWTAAGAPAALAGLQASVRWHHPERGWLMAAEFAPAGLRRQTPALLDWVLQQALQLSLQWQALGRPVALCLNLTGLVHRANGLPASVGRALARQPGAPGGLSLELPEHLLADDRLAARRTIEQLGQLGLPVWLDAFGAGGAALADLRSLPLAGLLITPSLTAALPEDRGAAAVVRAITTLADGLGLPACAPGVASGAQAKALHALGCAQQQGRWFAPPMPADEATTWLASRALGRPGA